MDVPDGKLAVGRSKKSELSLAKLEDLNTLLSSEDRLPADLRAEAKPVLNEIKDVLKNEHASKDWYRELSLAEFKWDKLIDKVAIRRTEQAHPEIKDKKYHNLSPEEKSLYETDFQKLNDEILDAKYAQHPNWKRIEGLFKTVKSDLLAAVNSLKIPEEEKQFKRKIIEDVRLTLPYTERARYRAGSSCGSTQVNAFFHPSYGAFTVCAGLFNAVQSEKGLYMVLAHEIGHSIDPLGCAICQNRQASQTKSALNRLAFSGKKLSYSCDEWSKAKDRILANQNRVTKPKFDSLQGLYDCLLSKKELKEFNESNVNIAADRITADEVSDYSTYQTFTRLAQPTKRNDDGEIVPNEFYLRPDLLESELDNFSGTKGYTRDVETYEIFNQSLQCTHADVNGKNLGYLEAEKADRGRLFEAAINETKSLIKAKTTDWLSYCGTNCNELQADRLSRNSQENFADWIAQKALLQHLKSKTTPEEYAEFATVGWAWFCERPSAVGEATDLSKIEKQFSFEPHNDHRVRRLSIFSDAMAKLANCSITPEEQGFGRCEP